MLKSFLLNTVRRKVKEILCTLSMPLFLFIFTKACKHVPNVLLDKIVTSRGCGRGNVFVCLSVCLSVCVSVCACSGYNF